MVIVVAASFLLCWSPFYFVNLISQFQENSFLKKSNFVFTMLCIHLCGFLNSCLNPFIYNCMSHQFRESFSLILGHACCPFRKQKTYRNCRKFRLPSDFTNSTVIKSMSSKNNEYILSDVRQNNRYWRRGNSKSTITEL